MTTLREKIVERKHRQFSKDVLFLQDNTFAHKSRVAMKTNGDLRLGILEHSPGFFQVSCVSLPENKSKKLQIF